MSSLRIRAHRAQITARVPWGRPPISQTIAQMNPANSRATAVAAWFLTLPPRIRCRYRAHKRFCAAQAMAWTASGAAAALRL